MLVWSVWQTPPKGLRAKFTVETMVLETPYQQEAQDVYQRLLKQGVQVRISGPHESLGSDADFPLEY